ncbi:MAG: hypothetical protein ACOY3P_11450 [Planctomycetota bacterium]
MPRYQVVITRRPEGWQPKSPDDVPPSLDEPLRVIADEDNVFEAVRQAIYFNDKPHRDETDRWALVVDPDSASRLWSHGRICTPISYKVTPIWWPEGWEPSSPRDVPNCVWKARGGPAESAANFRQAENTVYGLNQQCIENPGTTWYVVVAVENEPVATNVAYDSSGTETTAESRRLHVIRPDQGGHGNCDHCPAHSFSCAQADWSEQVRTVTDVQSRTLRVVHSL